MTARFRACFAAFLSLAIVTGCGFLQPAPEIVSLDGEEDVFMTNDKPDAGYRVTVLLKNNGASGEVRVRATLFCSEGTFKDSQTVKMESGETQQFIFKFTQPSWRASDYKYIVETAPPAASAKD